MNVCVAEEKELAARTASAAIEGAQFPQPARRQLGHVDGPYTAVLAGEPVHDDPRAVGRTVVDENDLEIRVVIPEPRPDRLLDLYGLVTCRDDDGHARPPSRRWRGGVSE